MPWVNVISNGDYELVISQAGSGYSWRTHAGLNGDQWGKFIYVRDRDTLGRPAPRHSLALFHSRRS